MNKRTIDIELPAKVWEIIGTQFKLNYESYSEILSKIIKNHLASSGYYPDVESLEQWDGLKDIVDIIDDKVMSLVDLLERKRIVNHKEWIQLMQERIKKNTETFN